jgi:hypothetical protein
MMKKPLLLLLVSLTLASPALAGWEIKAKITKAREPEPEKGISAKTTKPSDKPRPPEEVNLTILLDGPRIKWSSDEKPDNFVIIDLEKQSYIVGFVSEEPGGDSPRKTSSKPQKIAVTGTLDEFLSLMNQFMETMKSMMQMMKPEMPKQPKIERSESTTKTDFIVKPGPSDKTIAGCKTNGASVIVMETQIAQPEGAKKTDLSATTKTSGELYMCPEIDTAYLIPYMDAIYKKLSDWGKKWGATFAEMMGVEDSSEEKPNLMAAPFVAEKYEDASKIWKSLKGFPFLLVETSPGKENLFGKYEVTSYKSREIAPSEFAVPKGYKTQKLEEMLGEMMGGMMGGMAG